MFSISIPPWTSSSSRDHFHHPWSLVFKISRAWGIQTPNVTNTMQLRELSCKTLQIPMKTIKPKKRGKIPKKTGNTSKKNMQPIFIGGINETIPQLVVYDIVLPTLYLFHGWQNPYFAAGALGLHPETWHAWVARTWNNSWSPKSTRKGHQLIGLVRGTPKWSSMNWV